ncbi:hypothetical protein BH10PSE17_BH10PSE17_09110 [soil metagenome]
MHPGNTIDSHRFGLTLAAIALAGTLASGDVHAQATGRTCADGANETPGPACLVAHADIGELSSVPVFWSIYTFPDLTTAQRASVSNASIVLAFGQVWLFSVGAKGGELVGGSHLADVGPIPIDAAGAYSAEYLKSTFSPGMTAPVHVHSGPEAFYVIRGATCLETPEGVQVSRGPGSSLMVRRGPPMLLKAIGNETRQGFALILHTAHLPPTTLTSEWTPKGECPD